MTEMEAGTILYDVIKQYWPGWDLTATQAAAWTRRLQEFDFKKSQKVIEDVHFSAGNKAKAPPAGKLLNELKHFAPESTRAPSEREPLMLYEIRKEGNSRGMRFFLSGGRPANDEAPQIEANRICEELNHDENTNYAPHHVDYRAELERRKSGEQEQLRILTADDKLRLQLEILDGPDRPAKRFLQWYLDSSRKRDESGHIREEIKLP